MWARRRTDGQVSLARWDEDQLDEKWRKPKHGNSTVKKKERNEENEEEELRRRKEIRDMRRKN